MRFYDPTLGKMRYKNDPAIITICFSQRVARQASTARELLALVTSAAASSL